MKKIYALDSWVLFLIIIIPAMLQNSSIGDFLLTISFLIGATWVYLLTVDLYKKLPGGHFMSLNKFRFHFFFPIIYVIVVVVTMGGYSINTSNMAQYGALGLVIILLHLFMFYCIFYCFYFTAKALVSVYDKNKQPELISYVGYIFCFFFLPIGIWFIQPKVRTIFSA